MSCAFSRAELRKSKQNGEKDTTCDTHGRISGDKSYLKRVQVINENRATMYIVNGNSKNSGEMLLPDVW